MSSVNLVFFSLLILDGSIIAVFPLLSLKKIQNTWR